jgi:hypothetical protein
MVSAAVAAAGGDQGLQTAWHQSSTRT